MRRSKVEAYLAMHSIVYTPYDHIPVFTCEEADAIEGDIPGLHTKNLFVRDKKKTRYILLVMPAHKRTDLDAFAKHLGIKRLSFASAEDLGTYLDVIPGSVSPFTLISDPEAKVEVYIETEVMHAKEKGFHPNQNDSTFVVDTENFQKYLDSLPHTVHTISL